MKKSCLTLSRLFICSLIIILGIADLACGDQTVLKQNFDDSASIQIRAKGWWEICVPVYFKFSPKGRKSVTSAPFYCYPPESIETKELRLEIHQRDQIIFLYREEESNVILALVGCEDNLVYPTSELTNWPEDERETYHSKLQTLFSTLKELLENDELELSGYPWISQEE
jgi:hypothetical protein